MEEEQVHLFSRRVLSLVRWDERGSDWYFWLRAAIYSGDNRGNQSRLCGYKFQKIYRGDGRLILHITKTKLWLCQELLGKLLQRHFVWSYRLFWTNDSQPILYVGLKHLAFVNVICKQKHTFTNKKKKNLWRYFIRHRKCGKDIFFPLFLFVRLKSLFLSFSILTTRCWSSGLPLWPK